MSILPTLLDGEIIGTDTETTGLGPDDVPVGLSWARRDGSMAYARWGQGGGENNVTLEQARNWWHEEVVRRQTLPVLHNALFDMRMLVKVGFRMPARFEDTGIIAGLTDEHRPSYSLDGLAQALLDGQKKSGDELYSYLALTFGGKPTREEQGKNISKAPGNIVAPYAEQDAWLTLQLYLKMRPWIDEQGLERVYDLETNLIPVLVRMYRAGIRVDEQLARHSMADLHRDQERAQGELDRLAGAPVNAVSAYQLAPVLERLGITVPKTPTTIKKKIDKKTGEEYDHVSGGNPSVTGEWLDDLDHEIGSIIRRTRKSRHYADVFIGNYILNNLTRDSTIHANFHAVRSTQGGAKTGRFSSSGGLNAQNIPSRDEVMGALVKNCFVPYTPGGLIGEIDYSQIEYRFFAHYAGGGVMKAYNDDPTTDFHDMVAALTGLPRRSAKNINFGILFGMGKKKMAASLGVSLAEASKILATYFARIPEARKLSTAAEAKAQQRGYIITWGGRRCRFPLNPAGGRYDFTHKALNYIVQGSAADLNKTAMVLVDKAIDWDAVKMHLTIHDSLVLSFPGGRDGIEEGKRVQKVMDSAAPDLRVPIASSLKMGPTWGKTTAVENLETA